MDTELAERGYTRRCRPRSPEAHLHAAGHSECNCLLMRGDVNDYWPDRRRRWRCLALIGRYASNAYAEKHPVRRAGGAEGGHHTEPVYSEPTGSSCNLLLLLIE